jgi:hypothetical protein
MTDCDKHHKSLPCEDCKAEQQKKAELYDPEPCLGDPDNCSGDCDDCDSCDIEFDEDEDW